MRTEGKSIDVMSRAGGRRHRFHSGEALVLLAANTLSTLGRHLAEQRPDGGGAADPVGEAEVRALGTLGKTIGQVVWRCEGTEFDALADRLTEGEELTVGELRAMRDDIALRFAQASLPSRPMLLLAHRVIGRMASDLSAFAAGIDAPEGARSEILSGIERAQAALVRHADAQVQ